MTIEFNEDGNHAYNDDIICDNIIYERQRKALILLIGFNWRRLIMERIKMMLKIE